MKLTSQPETANNYRKPSEIRIKSIKTAIKRFVRTEGIMIVLELICFNCFKWGDRKTETPNLKSTAAYLSLTYRLGTYMYIIYGQSTI